MQEGMTRPGIGRGAIFAAALCVAGASGAEAQTPSPLGFWQFSAGQVLVPVEEAPKWRITLGPTYSYQPKYEGSQHYEFQPGLNFEVRYKERLYLSTGEGLGYDLLRGRNYRAGVGLTYDLGRRIDSSELAGLNKVRSAPQFRVYGEYVLRPKVGAHEFPIILSVTMYRAIGGYDGFNADAGAYMPIAGSAEKRWFVFAGGSASFADDDTLQAYFGVTPQESARSGYRVYRPNNSFRSFGTGIDAGWYFTEHWLISGSVGSKWLVGDASHSPYVFQKWQLSSNVSIGYTF
jgi:outer membrane scaffolding protein for murein synthesis (MipA/OmpV family)